MQFAKTQRKRLKVIRQRLWLDLPSQRKYEPSRLVSRLFAKAKSLAVSDVNNLNVTRVLKTRLYGDLRLVAVAEITGEDKILVSKNASRKENRNK
jgi:hypothetical protein